MDASPRKMISLMSDAYTRFVVPVYQRAYSWDVKQCVQLWDDIVSCGRSRRHSHFTGSIVTIQDGSVSGQGVATHLLIDGQQRTATVTLLLVAMARYAAAHPERRLSFSREEILGSGYLTNAFRTGEDHYKLTLSKGDAPTMRSLVDNLEDPSAPVVEDSPRLLENLSFFEGRIRTLADPNVVWEGIRRLEVVSISLAQGQDNPQMIFESMNSTGKDLAPADLIRNFMLMNFPVANQAETYRIYWRPMEESLRATTYDQRFDDFIRTFLAVVLAPEALQGQDLYQSFKRYVYSRGYNLDDRFQNLLLKMKRYARYYADITGDAERDPELRQAFSRLAAAGARPFDPLLVSLYEAYEQKDFVREDFLSVLRALEGYLVRRAVCDCSPAPLGHFASTLVARLDAVREEGGKVPEALIAMLINESGTSQRFPSDAEFALALKARATYDSGSVEQLLAQLAPQADVSSPDLPAQLSALWPLPDLPEKVCEVYRSTHRAAPTDAASFELLFKEGVINPGDTLVSADPSYPGRGTVTDLGTIVLEGDTDREAFTGPSAAYERLLASLGATFYVADAWSRWRLGEDGPTLDRLRM